MQSPSLILKPYNVHTTNHHLCGNGEKNGAQRRANVSFGRNTMQAFRAAAVGEKAHLRMKRHLRVE